jgi:hypothetical protein
MIRRDRDRRHTAGLARFDELLAAPLAMERLTEITPWVGRRSTEENAAELSL